MTKCEWRMLKRWTFAVFFAACAGWGGGWREGAGASLTLRVLFGGWAQRVSLGPPCALDIGRRILRGDQAWVLNTPSSMRRATT